MSFAASLKKHNPTPAFLSCSFRFIYRNIIFKLCKGRAFNIFIPGQLDSCRDNFEILTKYLHLVFNMIMVLHHETKTEEVILPYIVQSICKAYGRILVCDLNFF